MSQPSFRLIVEARRFALHSISPGQRPIGGEQMKQTNPATNPYDQLIVLFKQFPVLARLWSELISQWCENVEELLLRFNRDSAAISENFFSGQPLGRIIDLQPGFSDAHNGGRTVTRVLVKAGCVIYKPRPGNGEREWHRLVHWSNRTSKTPLKAAQVLCRKRYCWMEEITAAPCQSEAGVRRFYERIGATAAVAYLLRAVDCHRGNIIASGEWPVLIDLETLSHSMPRLKGNRITDPLYRTGFFPLRFLRSGSQPESSALGKPNGQHKPKLGRRIKHAVDYGTEIVRGFEYMWRHIVGCQRRRTFFVRRIASIQRQPLRRIYMTTTDYNAIRLASIQPMALRSQKLRDSTLFAMLNRKSVSKAILEVEICALKRLDIPWFDKVPPSFPTPRRNSPPDDLAAAILQALRF
jgi:lantibiotic modifying enzyme